MNPRFINALVFMTSCVIALAGAELALRLWGPEVLAMGNQYVFYRYDPVLGWDNLANARGRFSRSEFSYLVQINSIGMRDPEIAPKRSDEYRVAVLGDSFTWGVGVSYGERFTERLEARDRRLNVLNFGVSGFGPIQYLLQLDKVLSMKPDYIIVAFCLGNDVSDNVSYAPYNHPKPYVVLTADGESFEIKGYPLPDTRQNGTFLTGAASTLRIVGAVKLLIGLANRLGDKDSIGINPAMLYVPLDKLSASQRAKAFAAFKLNTLIFAKMKTKIDLALGAHHFAVLLAPTKLELGLEPHGPDFNPNAIADRVGADLSNLGIPVIDGRAAIVPSDFWKQDAHWRPSGHEKIAALLAKYLAGLGDPRLQALSGKQ